MASKDNQLACVCKECGHKWLERLELPNEVSVVVRHIKKMRCPNCATKAISCVFGDAAKAAGF